MVTTFQAIVLGLLQGLSEFLPVSSSAHLSLAPWLFGWQDPGLSFDVALHVGTLIAVLWYFRHEWAALLHAAWQVIKTRRIGTFEQRRAIFLIIATIPGGIVGLLLEKKAESALRSPIITAWALIVMGVVLWVIDRGSRMNRTLTGMKWVDALIVGCAQALALIPGVSRSGATITGGRFLGFDRQSAATFSFLMSMPIIAAAAVFKVPEAIAANGISAPIIWGVIASAVSGAAAISVLLKYVIRHSYGAFAAYRVVLGVVILVLYHARG